MKHKEWKLKINGKKTVAESAEGVKGCLIRDVTTGESVFRVYDKNDFTDYDIAHQDLDVKILKGASAAFYRGKDRNWLDYDPETLFLTEERKRELGRIEKKRKGGKRDK